MEIRQSAIFRAHVLARQALADQKQHYRAMWTWYSLIPIAIVGLLFVFWKFPHVPRGNEYRALILLFYTAAVISVSAVMGTLKQREAFWATEPIENAVRALSENLGISIRHLSNMDVEIIQKHGRLQMLSRAGSVKIFDACVEQFEMSGPSYITDYVRVCLNEKKDLLHKQLVDLKEALYAFRLTPKTYDWAFKEASECPEDD